MAATNKTSRGDGFLQNPDNPFLRTHFGEDLIQLRLIIRSEGNGDRQILSITAGTAVVRNGIVISNNAFYNTDREITEITVIFTHSFNGVSIREILYRAIVSHSELPHHPFK